MGYVNYSYDGLKELCNNIFEKFGYSKEDSWIITDILLTSDMFGIESHGIQRLILYYSGIRKGRIQVDAHMKILKETPLSVLVDGNKAMGQLVGKKAMSMAIEKAKKMGIGMAIVRNSNHFGIAGYYARMAEQQGLIGISMTNTQAVIPPTNGKRQLLGTNPIAIAMPAKPIPFLLDMSTSVVTRGKIEVYNKINKLLPIGWALDSQGKDIQDAGEVIEVTNNGSLGGILPIGGAGEILGGHKGYGLALAVEMFTSILSGGITSDKVRFEDNVDGVSHAFMAIDYGMFGNKEEIESRMSDYMEKLRNSERIDENLKIYTHGEKEIEAYNRRIKEGIPLNDSTIKEIKEVCNYLDIDVSKYMN